jgi:type I restriction enzyme S subunit
VNGTPVIRGGNLSADVGIRLDENNLVFIDEELASSFERSSVKIGDLIFTCWGTINQVGLIDSRATYKKYIVSNKQMKLSVDTSKIDPLFLYYFFSSPTGQDEINSRAIGSSVPGFNLTQLRLISVPTPPIRYQQSILSVLTALDDKIELNRRTNETLEAMAQAIFRDWFIDFGPVRRKQAGAEDPIEIMGRVTSDAAQATKMAALFPEALGNDGLPGQWTARAIGDLVEIGGGSTPSTANEALWEPAVHRWATPKDLSGMSDLALFETGRRISDDGLFSITSGLLPPGTVLLSSRAPIGYLAIAQAPVAINQGFIALKPTADVGSGYLYLWCKANMEAIVANANGSTFQEISKKNFRPIATPLPVDLSIIRAFGEVAQPLIDRIVCAAAENRTLAETRDYLLPRLMSGAVRVSAAAESDPPSSHGRRALTDALA